MKVLVLIVVTIVVLIFVTIVVNEDRDEESGLRTHGVTAWPLTRVATWDASAGAGWAGAGPT